jgi:hypothetical protein
MRIFTIVVAALAAASIQLCAQPTAITYQGVLNDGAAAASGSYDFRIGVYDSATGGVMHALLPIEDVAVSNGLFRLTIDLPGVFSDGPRWIAISVRPGTSSGVYEDLLPRQEITSTPYALRAFSVLASNIVGFLPE